MKILYGIAFLLFFNNAVSQKRSDDFWQIDNKVKYIDDVQIDSLTKKLIQLGNSDREKVRAIFRWITEHIDYNTIVFNRTKKYASKNTDYDPEDTFTILPPLSERVAAQVLRKRIAVCDGYSRLFKTLCDRAGIPSEIISGYARTNIYKKQPRFGVNHIWNAVYIDSAWHLLDVTWASGGVNYANEYIRQYNDHYFLTPPEDFIRDHYPEDLQWTLMKNSPSYFEFNNSPFKYAAIVRAAITSYAPSKGIIEAEMGDTIRIELKTNKELKDFCIAETPVFNSNQSYLSATPGNNGISFNYPVTQNTGQWLYIFYNDETVMRYKLSVKKETDPEKNKLAVTMNY